MHVHSYLLKEEKKVSLRMCFYVLASARMSAHGHVCIYTCSVVCDPLSAAAEAPSQGKEQHSDSFPV